MLSFESAVMLNPSTGNTTRHRKERKPTLGPLGDSLNDIA
jgi:hypothetical protein